MNPETPTENQNQEIETKKVEKQNPLIIPFSIIVAGALIGAGIYFSSKNPSSNKQLTKSASVESITIEPITEQDHILGNPNASVFIVEFSDTECPFCKAFHTTMKRIMDEYGKDGKVAWVYRQFPIEALHPKAGKEAEATECVAELGGNTKFWQYLDKIFETTQSNDSLDPAQLPKLAVSVGIDEKKFNDCLSSGKYRAKVLNYIQDAVRSGAKGTPSSVLVTKNGDKALIEGAQPYEVLKSVIDASLK